MENGNSDRVGSIVDTLSSISECERALARLEPDIENEERVHLYMTSSWFLSDCRRTLTKDGKEAMIFVSGLDVGSCKTLDRGIPLEYAKRSVYRVLADHDSVKRAFSELSKRGQKLLGWFHSHPGNSLSQVTPSMIDMGYQRDLELAKYPAIGGIFNRAGFIRFFSDRIKFEVVVQGHSVEEVDKNVFRITE